jgi:hypothetical protein
MSPRSSNISTGNVDFQPGSWFMADSHKFKKLSEEEIMEEALYKTMFETDREMERKRKKELKKENLPKPNHRRLEPYEGD